MMDNNPSALSLLNEVHSKYQLRALQDEPMGMTVNV